MSDIILQLLRVFIWLLIELSCSTVFDVQPLFPSISHSSHFDALVCCLQSARVDNVRVDCLLDSSQNDLSD